MATAVPPRSAEARDDRCVELRDGGWAGYATRLRPRAERGAPKMIDLDGSLLLVSPSLIRELLKERLGASEGLTGAAFPFLTAAEISGWVGRTDFGDETQGAPEVRRWVRDVLAPRLQIPNQA